MKKIILGLSLLVSSCAPAYASLNTADYGSPVCVFSQSVDMDTLREVVTKQLLRAADRNQAMLIDDIGEQDVVVAATNLFCENKSPKAVLEWIGL